jgi:hypothetical protein
MGRASQAKAPESPMRRSHCAPRLHARVSRTRRQVRAIDLTKKIHGLGCRVGDADGVV